MAGNVGIGTTYPIYELDVSNNTSNIVRITNSGTASNTNLEISHITNQNRIRILGNIVNNAELNGISRANDVGIIYGQTGVNTGGLVIAPNNTTQATGIRMAMNGNVGFGVQVPQTAVDISGLVRIINDDGVITLQGNTLTNMGVGNLALNAITTGLQNTAFGYNTLTLLTTGSFNTAIGYNAFNSATNRNQSTAIGYNAQPTDNNQVVLGTATESVFIPGTTASQSIFTGALQVVGGAGIQGNIYSGNLYVSNNAYANYFITTSDYRIKKDPQPLGNLYSVDSLKPVQYTNMLSNKQDMGFLAHEVQEVYPFLVEGEKDGDTTQALNYQGLIAVLVKEIQDLKKRVAILEQK
jgi:hypothetical protein